MPRIASAAALFTLCSLGLSGAPQPLDPAAQVKTAPKPTLHQVYSPFWSVAPGYESTVQLHNNLSEPLLVRPVLLSPSGIRIELADLTLPKFGNASINLHDALAGAGNAVANWGSAVFEYTSLYAGALLAETTVAEPEETLSYTIIGTEIGAKSSKLYGIYWFPQGNEAKAYIALQNASDNPIHVSAQLGVEPSSSPFSSVTLGPRQSQLIGAIIPSDNSGRGNSKDRSGSIVLTHDGAEGALITSGWTEMEDSGYSNMMTLYDPARHTGTNLYGSQIFLGKRDDLLASGKSLKIESYMLLLNTSDNWVNPRAELA